MFDRQILSHGVKAVGVAAALMIVSMAEAQTYFIDFGPPTLQGNDATTASPDANNNTWNNFSPGSFIRVEDSDGNLTGSSSPLGIGLGLTTGAGVSVLPDEGLQSPDPALLGELAVETATQDHIFRFDDTGTATLGMEFSSVETSESFTLSFLATRSGIAGECEFEVVGASTFTDSVVYTDNDRTLVVFPGVQAAANGTIQVNISRVAGEFVFINAAMLELEGDDTGCETCDDSSNTTLLIDTGPRFLAGQDARTQTDPNGRQWNDFWPGTFIRVLDTDGQAVANTHPDGIGFGATSGVGSSLFADEGLESPDPAFLCELAIESATRDHIFAFIPQTPELSFEFSSVDPAASLTIRFFSSRNGVDGTSNFEVTGGHGTATASVEYLNNACLLATVTGVQSDPDTGVIGLTITPNAGDDFVFLNAIMIELEGTSNPGCNAADLAEQYGILDLADISTFVSAFSGADPLADLDDNGIFDLADISAFVAAFLSGCP